MALGWQTAPVQFWNGTQWQDSVKEYWDGTQWQASAWEVYTDSVVADTTPPVVGFTSPAAGSTISGVAHITGTVTDGSALASVVVKVGSTTLGNAAITGNSWAIDINTSGLPNGNITLSVEATDTFENIGVVPRGFLINNVGAGGQDQTGPYEDPTLTSSTVTSISSGTLVLPNDARLTYGGADNIQDPGTFPGEWRPDFIQGTTGTFPPYAVTFNFSGSAFELYYRTHMSAEEVRFVVNGKWKPQTTTAGYRTTLGSGVRGYTRVDFGSSALRTIRINLRTWFSGIRVANDSTLTKAANPTFEVVGLGDSLTGGTRQGSGDTSLYYTGVSAYFMQTVQDLGWGKNAYNESIGGSGFTVNGDGGGSGTYIARTSAAVNARNPNVVMLDAHVLNDQQAGRTSTQTRDALIAVLTSMRNALPFANIMVALTPLAPAIVTSTGSIAAGTALVKSYNDPMRIAAASFGAYVIDPLDGNVYNTTGALLGNPEGARWQMPTGQTYPSTYMTSDGVHPTREGSWIFANQTTAAIQLCRSQTTWQGPTGEINQPTDTAPPTVPTLQTPSVTSTSMTFTWTTSTDPSGVAGYNIYLAGVKQNTTLLTTPTFTRAGLTPNTNYGPWEVSAVDASPTLNESGRSNQVTARTDAAVTDSTAPSVPTGLIVSPANGGWTASWNPSADAESGVIGYKVYDGSTPKPITTLLTYTATGYPNGTPVSVSVSAVNGAGLESARTATIVVTPTVGTSQPFQPVNLAVVPGDQQMRVTWDAPTGGATPAYYNIYFGGLKVGEERLLTGIFDDVPNGVAIAVQVAAVDAAGNEGPKSVTVTDTPYAPSALGAPGEVSSFGPNGTHWPDRTPWLYSTTIPTVIDVACTWDAIKTAVNGLTDAQVTGGVKIRVAPGQLPGAGASAGSTPMMVQVGKRSWRKRVLIVPRDGRGTITFSDSVNLKQCYNICLALFDWDQSMGITWVGCSYSAWAWSSAKSCRITGLGGTNTTTGLSSGECTDGFDCVEIVLPYVITGDLDPAQWSGGDPGTAGPGGGNGWMRFGRWIGCYIAPQYRPIGGTGHNDGLQLQSGGGLYYGIRRRDCAIWGSTNAAFQLGGWSQNGAPGNPSDIMAGPLRYFSWTDHCIDINATTGQVRYPINPATMEAPTASQAYNGIGRPPQHYAKDTIATGGMYTPDLTWTTVTNSRYTNTPAPSVIVGGWTLDTAILQWPASTWNQLSPVPDPARLSGIWSANPPAQSPPVVPPVGDTTGGIPPVLQEAPYSAEYSASYGTQGAPGENPTTDFYGDFYGDTYGINPGAATPFPYSPDYSSTY